MKNELLAMMLMKMFHSEELFDIGFLDIEKYFENDGYDTRNVAKEDLNNVLKSSAMTAFTNHSVAMGFKAGVDTVLMMQGKDPAFGVLDDYSVNWKDYNETERGFYE